MVFMMVFDTVVPGRSINWLQIGSELTMTQAWYPTYFRPSTWNYNLPLWFVSAMATFWLLEEAMFSLAVLLWRSGRMLTWTMIVAVCWTLVSPFSVKSPLYGWSICGGDESPLNYLPEYFGGVVTAFVVQQRAADGVQASAWFASITTLMLLGMFLYRPAEQWCHDEYWCRDTWVRKIGVLTPVFCIQLLGLAEGGDPLSRALAVHPLPLLGPLAFPYYAFQAPVYNVLRTCGLKEWCGGPIQMAILLSCLILVAFVVQRYVQEPAQNAIIKFAKSIER
mmetsp:Transcript_11626/g.31299  ORF Transcript_11626/g.31299 Transcript_11626/m.31299 type:complete len:279 (-) Transcript_11626:170-1006(-)